MSDLAGLAESIRREGLLEGTGKGKSATLVSGRLEASAGVPSPHSSGPLRP